jgi:two-component system sensor histidine kinase VanS
MRILIQFFVANVIFILTIIAFYVLNRYIFSQFTWHSYDFIYPLLHFLNENIIFLIVSICVIGFVTIFVRYWIKTLGYLEDIIHATENIYDSNDEFIILPADLKEVESQLNQIKLNVRQNERAAKEAEQRKNDLVVYLAHDLKTPLTSVIGYLTLLRDESQISEELRQKYLSISLEKAERLEELINEFFEITRFNLSNLTLELSKVNLTRMLEQITYEFQPMLTDKGLQCNLTAMPDITIKCDVNKMQRVFDNLFRNAINYSFQDSTIEITAIQKGNGVTLKFLNHGNTIPKEKLERIFEQFYRLDTSRTTNTGGAGLGLAIAKQIVELHQGTITAFSDNEVIAFEVTLPAL